LVPNSARRHPYQENVPDKYRNIPRWYLLDTDLDTERPWKQTTNLPVFSIALVRCDIGQRRWLLYAHSPLEDRRNVKITLPEYGEVTVDVPRAGAFYVVDEQSKSVRIEILGY